MKMTPELIEKTKQIDEMMGSLPDEMQQAIEDLKRDFAEAVDLLDAIGPTVVAWRDAIRDDNFEKIEKGYKMTPGIDSLFNGWLSRTALLLKKTQTRKDLKLAIRESEGDA